MVWRKLLFSCFPVSAQPSIWTRNYKGFWRILKVGKFQLFMTFRSLWIRFDLQGFWRFGGNCDFHVFRSPPRPPFGQGIIRFPEESWKSESFQLFITFRSLWIHFDSQGIWRSGENCDFHVSRSPPRPPFGQGFIRFPEESWKLESFQRFITSRSLWIRFDS